MLEHIIPIYSGVPEDFYWVGFGSGSGTNLRECAKIIKPSLIFSNKKGAGLFSQNTLLESQGIEHKLIESIGYKGRREEYDKKILDMLHRFEDEKNHGIDLIVLGGYMRIVSDVLLEAFKDKFINVHPADLSMLIGNKRKYVGEDAVYDALLAGERSTRSSVIMVDDEIDHGEILTQGQHVHVTKKFLKDFLNHGNNHIRSYVDGTDKERGYQDFQKELSDWPALTTALKLISEGRLGIGTKKVYHNEWRGVYLDGKKLPYEGLRI